MELTEADQLLLSYVAAVACAVDLSVAAVVVEQALVCLQLA